MVIVHGLEHGERDFRCIQEFNAIQELLFLQSVEFAPSYTFSSWGHVDVPLDRRCVVGNFPPSECRIYNLT